MNFHLPRYLYLPISPSLPSYISQLHSGTDQTETQVIAPEPAPTEIGSTWEEADRCDLEAAKHEAEEAKEAYFSHQEHQETKPILDVQGEVGSTEETKTKEGATKTNEQLQVHNTSWQKKHELKRRSEKAAITEETAKLENEQPPIPATFGQAPSISPNEQCPPKPRGRKPKAKEPVDPKKNEPKQSKRGRSGTKKNGKEEQECPKKKAKSSSSKTAVVEKDEGAVPEDVPKRKKPRNSSKVDTAQTQATHESHERPSIRTRNYLRARKLEAEAKEKEAIEKENSKKRAKDKKDKKASKAETKPKKEEVAKAEKKKALSRKSAAYHAAYKATEGNEDVKRASARNVL